MKSIYFWIVAAVLSLGFYSSSAQADDVTFSVYVPNPDGVLCQKNGEDVTLVQGKNTFTVAEYTNFYFSSKSPWRLTGVTDKNGTTPSGFYGDTWYLTVFSSYEGEEFTLLMTNLDDMRTSEFTLKVDDPSLIQAVLGGYNTYLSLEAGENTIKFDPAVESQLTIRPATNLPIYSVKKDGVNVAPYYGTFEISLEDDVVIDVTAILPDEDRTVTFSYAEGADGSISVYIADNKVNDFNGDELVVKLGDQLRIEGNVANYKFNGLRINNEFVNFTGSYTFNVMEDTQVYVDAAPYGTLTATVIVPDPSLVKLYTRDANYNSIYLDIHSGENILELPENNSEVFWEISSNAIINAITVINGENTNSLSSYYTSYTLKEGDVLSFDLTEKVYDQTAVVWIDNNKGKANSIYTGMGSQTDHSFQFSMENGYNLLSFYAAMNPFQASWFGQSEDTPNISLTGKLYLNDVLLEPQYENSSSYSFTLENNDVLKFFMDAAPVDCKVEIDLAEDVEAEIVKDIVTVVANPAEGFDCFAGTQVTVSGNNLVVKLNGEKLSADAVEEAAMARETSVPSYTFTVTDPETKVELTADTPSAISTIETNAVSDNDVFNSLGVKVGKASQLKDLAPGLYIVKGKKIVLSK